MVFSRIWRGPHWRGVTAAAVLVLALLAQLALFDRSHVPMDEGNVVETGRRVLAGERLYSDLHTGHGPGVYYLTALLLWAGPTDVIVTRWAQMLLNAGTAACLWLVGLRAMRPAWSALPPLLYVALVALAFPALTMFNYSPLAMGFALLALVSSLRYLEFGRARQGALAGALLAASVLTKLNFGTYASVAVGLVLLSGWSRSSLANRPRLAILVPVAAGGASLLGVTALHFAGQGSLCDWIDSTVLSVPGAQFRHYVNPFPPILALHLPEDPRFVFQYLPPALFGYLVRGEPILGAPVSPLLQSLAIRLSYGLSVLVLVAASLALLGRWRNEAGPSRDAARAILIFAVLLYLGLFPSAIWSHLAYVMPPVLLAAGLLGDRVDAWLDGEGRLRLRVGWRVASVGVALAAVVVLGKVSVDVHRWYPIPWDLPRASLRVDREQALLWRRARTFVEGCSEPGEFIFAAPVLPLLYFVSDRRNPTPYDLLIPGRVDGPAIIEALEASGTRCMVFDTETYPEYPPFAELFPEVHRYFEQGWETRLRIRGERNTWLGLVRREAARP